MPLKCVENKEKAIPTNAGEGGVAFVASPTGTAV